MTDMNTADATVGGATSGVGADTGYMGMVP